MAPQCPSINLAALFRLLERERDVLRNRRPSRHLVTHSPPAHLLGGSNTTVTIRLPQAGHMRRAFSRERGKFGPRVQTSVSRSSCPQLATPKPERITAIDL